MLDALVGGVGKVWALSKFGLPGPGWETIVCEVWLTVEGIWLLME